MLIFDKQHTNKYIFLPAGGRWNYTTHYDTGSSTRYWATKYYDSIDSWNMDSDPNFVGMYHTANQCGGRSIRPLKF